MHFLVRPLAYFLLLATLTNGEEEHKSLSERIAFACAHKPTLSFCAPRNAPVVPPRALRRLSDDPGAVAPGARYATSAEVSVAQKELARLSETKETPKHRRWVFIPNADTGEKRARDEPREAPMRSRSSASETKEPLLIVPPDPFSDRNVAAPTRALQSRTFPVLPSDAAYGAGQVQASDTFRAFDGLTDEKGLAHRPRSRSPFTKPGLWEPNPDDPHSRDPANKWWYKPESVGVDWLNGQLQWGGHWAVPAAGIGGTNGQSTLHFPSIGTFLGIPDDYD